MEKILYGIAYTAAEIAEAAMLPSPITARFLP
jgi:hypothetical protein